MNEHFFLPFCFSLLIVFFWKAQSVGCWDPRAFVGCCLLIAAAVFLVWGDQLNEANENQSNLPT